MRERERAMKIGGGKMAEGVEIGERKREIGTRETCHKNTNLSPSLLPRSQTLFTHFLKLAHTHIIENQTSNRLFAMFARYMYSERHDAEIEAGMGWDGAC